MYVYVILFDNVWKRPFPTVCHAMMFMGKYDILIMRCSIMRIICTKDMSGSESILNIDVDLCYSVPLLYRSTKIRFQSYSI